MAGATSFLVQVAPSRVVACAAHPATIDGTTTWFDAALLHELQRILPPFLLAHYREGHLAASGVPDDSPLHSGV